MKKIILLIIIFICLGCTKEIEKEEIQEPKEELILEQEEIIETYQDDNPIVVGLYNKGKLVHEYNTKFNDSKDIATFNIVFTQEEDLKSTNVKDNWKKYYQKYENIDNYKIGFYYIFETKDGLKENLMLDPSSLYKTDPYLYVYLYDGIHSKGKYTHLKMSDIKDDTIYSSIKLYLHRNTKDITSPISLTVFTYKDDNDFENNLYRGNSYYTITINNR